MARERAPPPKLTAAPADVPAAALIPDAVTAEGNRAHNMTRIPPILI
jgi:hypothetical protein